MPDPLILPPRNVISKVGNDDQRMIKWFESATGTVNALTEGATVSGGFLLDDGSASADGGFIVDDGAA